MAGTLHRTQALFQLRLLSFTSKSLFVHDRHITGSLFERRLHPGFGFFVTFRQRQTTWWLTVDTTHSESPPQTPPFNALPHTGTRTPFVFSTSPKRRGFFPFGCAGCCCLHRSISWPLPLGVEAFYCPALPFMLQAHSFLIN